MSQKKNKQAETIQNDVLLNYQEKEKESASDQETEIVSEEKTKPKKQASTELLAKLMDCFKAWPEVKELWQTTDGTCFFKKHDAENYARSIKGEAKLYKRDEVLNSKK